MIHTKQFSPVSHGHTHCYILQVNVHVHDRNGSISAIVGQQEGVKDALDTWHGEKEVVREMKKIQTGTKRDMNIK